MVLIGLTRRTVWPGGRWAGEGKLSICRRSTPRIRYVAALQQYPRTSSDEGGNVYHRRSGRRCKQHVMPAQPGCLATAPCPSSLIPPSWTRSSCPRPRRRCPRPVISQPRSPAPERLAPHPSSLAHALATASLAPRRQLDTFPACSHSHVLQSQRADHSSRFPTGTAW